MKWVIAYDVRRNRDRRRVARRLEQVGFRRQKSVFEGDASPAGIAALLDELAAFLQAAHDRLTAWPMTENGPAVLGIPAVSPPRGRPPRRDRIQDTPRDRGEGRGPVPSEVLSGLAGVAPPPEAPPGTGWPGRNGSPPSPEEPGIDPDRSA